MDQDDDPHISAIFTKTFDFCKDNFFANQEQRDQMIGELMRYISRPRELPIPTECGKHKSRVKELLPQTDVFVYYWDYGRVWEFFGVVKNGNDDQADVLVNKLELEDDIQ